MRILFVADGRSPTTLSWLKYWINAGDEVHLISTYACVSPLGLKSFASLNTALSVIVGTTKSTSVGKTFRQLRSSLRIIRYYLGPISLQRSQKQFLEKVELISPDLVHALRIPFEGMLSSITPIGIPLVVSIWGNDLTLHAKGSSLMRYQTRKALVRADALLADTERDIILGKKWGLRVGSLDLVIPGSGGLDFNAINSSALYDLPEGMVHDWPIIVNTRGQRPGSIRQDIFFQAIPKVLKTIPDLYFICPSLKDEEKFEKIINREGIQEKVLLWPKLSQVELWGLFKRAQIYISPSVHDGTPNSLLESMACGCFPVTGNIESMKEWISDGENGLLVNANSVNSLARTIIRSITDPDLRKKAGFKNRIIVKERADYTKNMGNVRLMYNDLLRIQ